MSFQHCVLHVDLVTMVQGDDGILLPRGWGSENLGWEAQAQFLVLGRHLDGLVHHLLQLAIGQLLCQGHRFLQREKKKKRKKSYTNTVNLFSFF